MEELSDRLEAEGLRLTSIPRRSYAFLIDDLIVSFLLFVAFYNSFANAKSMEEILVITNNLFIYIVFLKVAYHTFFVWQYGATMGKMLFGMIVVDGENFQKLSFSKSLIRAVVRVFSEAVFYLGFLWGVLNPTRQTWHDKACGSIVIDV